MKECRFCKTELVHTFVDLGLSPLCEDFIKPHEVNDIQRFFPLQVYVCHRCYLVQLAHNIHPDEFYKDYYYFSSYSDYWLKHAENYSLFIIEEYGIDTDKRVVEIASNDGYLLQYFANKNIPVVGIEPSPNVAAKAIEKGIQTEEIYFSSRTSVDIENKYGKADLIIGNNVFAHVPDINDFVIGLKSLLHENGIVTLEFPHLLQLIKQNQFDTIYHEHYCYLSLVTVKRIFEQYGMKIFDVEELPTHGGSLRIFITHNDNLLYTVRHTVHKLLTIEEDEGFLCIDYYLDYEDRVIDVKRKLLDLLIRLRRENNSIVGYGAPGKANTLLNYCGIRTDFLDYTVDRNPLKHGMFLPGSMIPIYHPEKIKETKPNYVVILPWNLKDEIMQQLAYIKSWGGKFIIPIPEPEILS